MLHSNFLIAIRLVSVLAAGLYSVAAFADTPASNSETLRATKSFHIALIDGVTMDGGARIGFYAGSNTVINLAYMEEAFSFGNEYNTKSRSVDLGVQQFLGNSFYTSLALRRMHIRSTNNNDYKPQISLWQKDNVARLAIGNQWQLVEGVTVAFEWANVGANLQRLEHSSQTEGFTGVRLEEAERQAQRDERKANRFYYNALHIELGYSF